MLWSWSCKEMAELLSFTQWHCGFRKKNVGNLWFPNGNAIAVMGWNFAGKGGLVWGSTPHSRYSDMPSEKEEWFLPPFPHFPVGTKPEQPDLLHLHFTWLAANVSQVSTAVDGLLTNQKVRSANLQYWLLASLPIKGFQMVTEPLTLMKTATKDTAPSSCYCHSLPLALLHANIIGLFFKRSTIPEQKVERPYCLLKTSCGCELFYILLRNYQTTSEND